MGIEIKARYFRIGWMYGVMATIIGTIETVIGTESMFNMLNLKCLQDSQGKMSITQLRILSRSPVRRCTFKALPQFKVTGNKNTQKEWVKWKQKQIPRKSGQKTQTSLRTEFQ